MIQWLCSTDLFALQYFAFIDVSSAEFSFIYYDFPYITTYVTFHLSFYATPSSSTYWSLCNEQIRLLLHTLFIRYMTKCSYFWSFFFHESGQYFSHPPIFSISSKRAFAVPFRCTMALLCRPQKLWLKRWAFRATNALVIRSSNSFIPSIGKWSDPALAIAWHTDSIIEHFFVYTIQIKVCQSNGVELHETDIHRREVFSWGEFGKNATLCAAEVLPQREIAWFRCEK